MQNCFHCGNDIVINQEVNFDEKLFCCNGCKTVYEIFSQNDMACYYDFENSPGAIPTEIKGKYDYLDNQEIKTKLLEFNEDDCSIVTLSIPHIHCSSCIWILENLNKLQEGIRQSQVNFPEKTVRITFSNLKVSFKEVVNLLCAIGYEPYISLENYDSDKKKVDHSLLYKLGVAFFSFGNIMLLSFPEYFEVQGFWLDQYKGFFRWLIFALALPSFLYAAQDYYISAYKSIKIMIPNIDIPITLGILVMFIRSLYDIVGGHGSGYFDSLTGLIFFILLGKYFQQRTYSFLSFERDYKSYFPIAVTKIGSDGIEEVIQVYDIQKGDRLVIRNQELIPVDGVLITTDASIDYSFVTGEAVPIIKQSGEKVYAGGKIIDKVMEMEVLFSVSQSYLTQLWSNAVFEKKSEQKHKTITDTISRYFTPILLAVAFGSLLYWSFIDWNTAFNVFTAVLIVACPCAIALTAPFTLGNILRILGNEKFYLKNATVIEQLKDIDTIVFDKTGTITTNSESKIEYKGSVFSQKEEEAIKGVLRGSNHPLSRALYDALKVKPCEEPQYYTEIVGSGISGVYDGITYKLGSAKYVGYVGEVEQQVTGIHVSIDDFYMGCFVFKNVFRNGLDQLFQSLSNHYDLVVLSGDNEGEKETLLDRVPPNTELIFNKKPDEKLAFIQDLQKKGKKVMMVGDGLNDAGALAQSDVGISISENINVFSPACDAILDASQFMKINAFMRLSKKAVQIIIMSFALSIVYNAIGLTYAISGGLSPIVAAIIMPLSSITVVVFVTVMSNWYSRKLVIKSI